MKVIELTQGQVAIVDDEDFEYLAQWRWHFNNGYARRNSPWNGSKRRNAIWMHREIIKPPEGFDGDHINGNKLDNRRCNLRIATRKQNCWNQKMRSSNTSGFKGVCWNQTKRKFIAQIGANGKVRHLGNFDSAEEAKAVYDIAALGHYGEFARLK